MQDVLNLWDKAAAGGHAGAIATDQFASVVGKAITAHAQGIAAKEGLNFDGNSGRSR